MRILPPPVWVLLYIVIAVGVSYLFGWPRISGLPIIWLGILLIIGAGVLMAFAIRLFRREGTEIDPIRPRTANSSQPDLIGSRAIPCISDGRSSR